MLRGSFVNCKLLNSLSRHYHAISLCSAWQSECPLIVFVDTLLKAWIRLFVLVITIDALKLRNIIQLRMSL